MSEHLLPVAFASAMLNF